ncbi:MAG: diacylglycerol kinase [Treponema sp.]|jgi:diacylglycerol kinase family enzyme|nr:diacylglycerol kinase [Treponema sp.]
MNIDFFAESLAEICRRSLVAPEKPGLQSKPLRWLIVANPAAGGFTMRSRLKKCRAALDQCLTAAQSNPLRMDCAPAGVKSEVNGGPVLASCGLVQTNGHGCAAKYAEALIAEAKTQDAPFYLIISAGGDGTSREILTAMYHAPAHVRSNMAILRLPMGTGNDGADSADLVEALMLLIKPSRIEFNPALRLITAPAGPAASASDHLAFNILSVGLDAFVTHMTNKMKGKLPGDSYKLWVDIASLLYDRLYTVDFLDVKADGGKIMLREKLLLLAVGASGHRTYGSQKKILPDDRNVCALKQMPLLRKIALKELFATGKHIDKPEAILFNARRVEFSGSFPFLAQMDGEAILLQPEDFPAVIELTEPLIPVLKERTVLPNLV